MKELSASYKDYYPSTWAIVGILLYFVVVSSFCFAKRILKIRFRNRGLK